MTTNKTSRQITDMWVVRFVSHVTVNLRPGRIVEDQEIGCFVR